jgi:hypothetical protein
MLLSMLLVCGGAALLWVFAPDDRPGEAVPTVDYTVPAATAARAAPYELLVPEGLPADWRATSVRYEPQGEFGATWRLGFHTGDEDYAAVAQADGDPEAFAAAVTLEAEDTGETVRVAGRDWARYEGGRYDALVLAGPDVTTVVLGTAPVDGLAELAAALRGATAVG